MLIKLWSAKLTENDVTESHRLLTLHVKRSDAYATFRAAIGHQVLHKVLRELAAHEGLLEIEVIPE